MEMTWVLGAPVLSGWAPGERPGGQRTNVSKGSARCDGPWRPADWPRMVGYENSVDVNGFILRDDLAGMSGLISRLCLPMTLTFFCPTYQGNPWRWNRMRDIGSASGIVMVRVCETSVVCPSLPCLCTPLTVTTLNIFPLHQLSLVFKDIPVYHALISVK